jgi:hypothetical protein
MTLHVTEYHHRNKRFSFECIIRTQNENNTVFKCIKLCQVVRITKRLFKNAT